MPNKTRREKAVAKAAAKLQSFDDWREDKRGKKPKKKKKPDATRRKMEKMHKQDQPLPHQLDKDKGSKKKPKGPSPSAVKARAKAAAKAAVRGIESSAKEDAGKRWNRYSSELKHREKSDWMGFGRKGNLEMRASTTSDTLPYAKSVQRMAEEEVKKKEKAKADAKRKAKAKKGKNTTPSKGRAPVE